MVNIYANVLSTFAIYSAKVMAFYCSIVGTFNTLCYWSWDMPSLATAFIAFSGIVLYLICFGGMYVIPDLAQELVELLFKATGKAQIVYPHRNFCEQRKVWRSVGPVRIKEGEFRYVERGSAPEFIDFYINQVIALVLAFR